MKKNNFTNPFKSRRFYLALGCVLPMFFVMCHEQREKAQRNDLNNQISDLDRQISETQDLRTGQMPQNLRSTQTRYLNTADSLDKIADTVGICMAQNEDLILLAFNNYAVRIGRNFQISNFLPQNDITTFQKYLAHLDSMDYIQDMARNRILTNNGSLNDLSYFLELLDFDSINSELENKLAWNFYTDSTNVVDEEPLEISTLCFENNTLNDALRSEQNLLNHAWKKNSLQYELNKNDSLRAIEMATAADSISCNRVAAKYDSLQKQIENQFETMDEYVPNFAIPEFDSVHTQYMRNDSVINGFHKTFDSMIKAEDTLAQYRQTIMRKRDSLIKKRNELEK